MTKPVQGYLTESGRFFESQLEATMNETEERLIELAAEDSVLADLDSEALIAAVKRLAEPFSKYTTAYMEFMNAQTRPRGTNE